jgi:hypothetical protein
MICSTCDAPAAVDSLKIWNSRTVCTDCFGVLSGQGAPSQPDPEKPRTIRETTVCPACQAEFHKNHPMCPECNTVLDPAFRVARQTKRAVQAVSELVVENALTTRRVAGHGLRRLISGFLWAVVVLTVLLIGGMISNGLTNTALKVPFCVAFGGTMIWLARRIRRRHFQPRPQLNNEVASKPLVNSSVVIETDSPSRFELEPQTANEKPEVLAPASEPDVARFEPESENYLVWLLVVCPLVFLLGACILSSIISPGIPQVDTPQVDTPSEDTTTQGVASQNARANRDRNIPEPVNFDNWADDMARWEAAKEFAKVRKDFSEAIRLKPDDAMYYTNRGFAYEKQGDQAEANADFAKSKELEAKK